MAIRVFDSVQYHNARATLERDGLLVRFLQPGGGLGSTNNLYGLTSQPGWLWVDATQLERAEQCLDEAGIAWSFEARPIVDRSEPKCPNCDAVLDPQGPEHCPQCATHFEWVQIEEPQLPLTNLHCVNCGYELTGHVSEFCTECNAPLPKPTLDALVAAAAGEPQLYLDHTRLMPKGIQSAGGKLSLWIAFAVFIGGPALGLISAIMFLINSNDPLLGLLVTVCSVALAALFFREYRRLKQRRAQSQ